MTQTADPKREENLVSKSMRGRLDFAECFECLPVSAAILGPDGTVAKVNRLWRDFALRSEIIDLSTVCEGVNYLDVCRRAARQGDRLAEVALLGLKSLLDCQTERIELEYPCHSPEVKRWFLLQANRFEDGLVMLHIDITQRKQSEDATSKSRDELEHRVEERTKALAESNAAMQFILKQRELDRKEIQEAVLTNVRYSIRPYLDSLSRCNMSNEATGYLKIVRAKIEEIVSSFSKNLSDKFLDLTPMQIRVAELIKDGHSTKEIGTLLHLSPGTIRYHRENLRDKLGIKNRNFNLRALLINIE